MTGVIAARIEQILLRLPKNVLLIAVSKQVSLEAIREAYSAGIRDFAENRLNEAIAKQEQLLDLGDIRWHFIGHLQTNKAKKVLQHFDWIHSVDSLKLAQVLNQLASDLPCSPQVCLQVKMLPDPNKYGWAERELLQDLPELDQCYHLKIQGLMTILPLGISQAETLAAFEATKKLQIKIKQQNLANLNMEQLSMGMSGDYLLAVQAGATMIRLGQIIFGQRKT